MQLHERWRDLCRRLGAVDDVDIGIPYADLVTRYKEEWRAYHTLAHIETMFAEFDEVKAINGLLPTSTNKEAVEMAIWYHDAVYNPRVKQDNEGKSAELFQKIAEYLFLEPGFTEKVSQMILATKHNGICFDYDTRLLCDLDLSILGYPQEFFDDYERQIREEYRHVPEYVFAKVRSEEVLQPLLRRRSIYSTVFFRESYDWQARVNLNRSIAQLSRRLQSLK
jgi:predicted metal-dependent HD superfamily phosphohydrolase